MKIEITPVDHLAFNFTIYTLDQQCAVGIAGSVGIEASELTSMSDNIKGQANVQQTRLIAYLVQAYDWAKSTRIDPDENLRQVYEATTRCGLDYTVFDVDKATEVYGEVEDWPRHLDDILRRWEFAVEIGSENDPTLYYPLPLAPSIYDAARDLLKREMQKLLRDMDQYYA